MKRKFVYQANGMIPWSIRLHSIHDSCFESFLRKTWNDSNAIWILSIFWCIWSVRDNHHMFEKYSGFSGCATARNESWNKMTKIKKKWVCFYVVNVLFNFRYLATYLAFPTDPVNCFKVRKLSFSTKSKYQFSARESMVP